MRQRRIFRPAPAPRRWGAFALGCGLLGAAALLAVAVPRDLLGSAAPEQRWSAAAPEVMVLDGDALRLGDRVLRLAGLSVPARGAARCGTEDCAAAAADALARLVRGQAVDCVLHGRDRHGRALGTCEAGEAGLNQALVEAGWALAEPGAVALQPAEAVARRAGRGLWGTDSPSAESWRNRH